MEKFIFSTVFLYLKSYGKFLEGSEVNKFGFFKDYENKFNKRHQGKWTEVTLKDEGLRDGGTGVAKGREESTGQCNEERLEKEAKVQDRSKV